jgi:hypothetical protein
MPTARCSTSTARLPDERSGLTWAGQAGADAVFVPGAADGLAIYHDDHDISRNHPADRGIVTGIPGGARAGGSVAGTLLEELSERAVALGPMRANPHHRAGPGAPPARE